MRIFDGEVYRDMTEEEIVEYESMQQQEQVQEISLEDRISAMEELLLDLL